MVYLRVTRLRVTVVVYTAVWVTCGQMTRKKTGCQLLLKLISISFLFVFAAGVCWSLCPVWL